MKSKYQAWTGLKQTAFCSRGNFLRNLLLWEMESRISIKTFLIPDSIVIVEHIISLSVALLNVTVKVKPNVSFCCFPKDSSP